VPIATKKPYWTEPYIGTIESDQDLIYFSYTAPVIVNGKIIGVAGSDYYFNKMKESLDQYNLKRKSDVILVDKNFNILVHPEISSGVNLFSYLINVDQKSIQNMKSSELGRFKYFGNDKQGRIMFYKRLDNDWYLIFTMSEAVIKDSVIGVGNVRILILVLISLLIIGLLQIGLVRLIKPLNRIKDSLMRMTDDHYDLEMSKPDIMRRDEFGDMAKSVEQLRVVWQERFSQEKISHQEMESLIEEKTLELKKTNEFLELSLEQLQEQNAETNIATEKYEDQLIKMQMLQKRLFQSEQLASLSYILIGLAYDLNSPIGNSTTMISYLKSERRNMIRKFNDGQLKKQELDDFMMMLEESLELLDRNMTIASNQVIQFKRLSSGQSQHSKTEFKLKETLNSIFNQCLIGMDKGNLRINLMMPELLILSDLGAFIQVFSNLIRYSINHSYFQVPKGMIAIHGEVIDDTSLLLTYEDFGNATSTSMLETAFVPYLTTQFQEQPQIVQLNICYHIITKIFEGSIRFESQGDEGNKFHMVLRVKIIERL
jgi:signal transduction histidine kinase